MDYFQMSTNSAGQRCLVKGENNCFSKCVCPPCIEPWKSYETLTISPGLSEDSEVCPVAITTVDDQTYVLDSDCVWNSVTPPFLPTSFIGCLASNWIILFNVGADPDFGPLNLLYVLENSASPVGTYNFAGGSDCISGYPDSIVVSN